MPLSPESRPNPRRTRRRHFRGLTDEQQKAVYTRQRDALVRVFNALEEYFTADVCARIEALDVQASIDAEIDAEFVDDPANE